jgi:hypothetical protein
MVVEILGLDVEIGHFPAEVQSAVAQYCSADLSVFEEFESAREILMDAISAIDESNDYDTDYVGEVEDLLGF